MGIRAILTEAEYQALHESTRSFYIPKDGHYALDVEGMEDTSGLKKALESERTLRKDAERAHQQAVLERSILNEAIGVGAYPRAFPDILNRARRDEVKDPKSLATWIAGLKKKAPHLFEGWRK